MIFHPQFTIDLANNIAKGCMVEHLGIEITEIGDDYMQGTMPVDHRTKQPFGLLHGGASVVLAETLGSTASNAVLNTEEQYAVGLEINANHVKSARGGKVTGTTKPIHLGKRTHIWETRVTDEDGKLVCISRFTAAILDKK